MNFVKHSIWSEDEIDALPLGEHDYFERKSGRLFDDMGTLLGELAKAVSALANSGGGHIILGVEDDGIPDGVPPTLGKGHTSTREWLEQRIPHLVEYPLGDFRVHEVQPAPSTRIPAGRIVIVVDVGDSALAPHQCAHGGGSARKYSYYYRQAGHSEPAPHFYLELLRQRLTNPVLEATAQKLIPVQAQRQEGAIFLATRLRFSVTNVGRLAAYKWQIQLHTMSGHIANRTEVYRFLGNYPDGFAMSSSLRLDDTILPGGALDQDIDIGLMLRPSQRAVSGIEAEINQMLSSVRLKYRVATETSIGKDEELELHTVLNSNELAEFVSGQLGL